MKHSCWAFVLVVVMGLAAVAQEATPWSVYVNDRKYVGEAQAVGEADAVQVEARSLARALGVGCQPQSGGKVTINGVEVKATDITDKHIMVALVSTTQAIGCRTEIHADTHRIDVRALRGMVPPDVQKSILGVPKISNPLEMDFLYGIVLDAMDRENLKLFHPVVTHWATRAEVQKLGGKDAYGYATVEEFGYNGSAAGIEDMQIFIPYGLTPAQSLHSIAHELAHCWQFDNGILDAPEMYTEGFAEWAASKVLERLNLDGEIHEMTTNLYTDYRDGYLYYHNLEQSVGFAGVLADMKAKAIKKK